MSSSSVRGAAALLLACAAGPALAVLGGDGDSVRADQQRWGAAARRQATAAGAQVHTLSWPDGSSIRQFAGADGRVYAVAWSMRTKPRLDELLGAQFGAYAQAARDTQRSRPGPQHSLHVERGDLVVEAVAQGNAHAGRAWLRSLLPAGRSTDAIR